MLTLSPSTRSATGTRWPLTNIPLRLPLSIAIQRPWSKRRITCAREIRGWATRRSARRSRPITTSLPGAKVRDDPSYRTVSAGGAGRVIGCNSIGIEAARDGGRALSQPREFPIAHGARLAGDCGGVPLCADAVAGQTILGSAAASGTAVRVDFGRMTIRRWYGLDPSYSAKTWSGSRYGHDERAGGTSPRRPAWNGRGTGVRGGHRRGHGYGTTLPTAVAQPLGGTDALGFVNSPARCDPQQTAVVVGRTKLSSIAICADGRGHYEYRGVRLADQALQRLPRRGWPTAASARTDQVSYTVSERAASRRQHDEPTRRHGRGPAGTSPASRSRRSGCGCRWSPCTCCSACTPNARHARARHP